MKVAKSIISIVISSFIICMFTSISTFAEKKDEQSSFNILIINSYHRGHYWESYVMEGFEEAAKEYNENEINIKVEYFDFRNRNDEEYIKSFISLVEKKYPKGCIDAIYTIDDESFSAVLPEITNELSEFYHVPLLFSGVDSSIDFTEEEEMYVTGIYQRDVTLEGINLILELDDSINSINIITEDSGFGENLISKANNIIEQHLKNKVTLNIIQGDYIEEIEEQLQNLEQNSESNEVVFLGGEFQYKDTDSFLTPKKTVEVINKYLSWPIYTNDPTYIAEDILGGCMDIGQLQGEEIFQRVKRLINGEDPADIKSEFAPAPKWLLKYNEIYKQNINVNNIPRKCIVIDKKFYQFLVPEYVKIITYYIVIFIITLILILIYKMVEISKVNKKEKKEAELRIEREKIQKDFIVNISEKLRVPANIILSGVDIIKIQLNRPYNEIDINSIEEMLGNINQNGYRALKLVNNIIDIKKIECGVLAINKRNIDIVEIVKSIFNETVDYANKKDIKMIFNASHEEIIISADMYLIQRVILNLLSNAIKFTLSEGVIYTSIKKYKQYIVIEIQDNGIGIEKEKLEKIFTRFYEVNNLLPINSEGNGIGLSIVEELIELHDGKVEAESIVGKGTTIRVFLPSVNDSNTKELSFDSSSDSAVEIEMSDLIK